MARSRKGKKSVKPRQVKKHLTTKRRVTKRTIPKVPKVKLVKAKKVRRLPKPILVKARKGNSRDLQAAIKYLRDIGLVKTKRDLRKIKKNDRAAKRQITKYSDVLEGKADVYTVGKPDAKRYQRAGYETVNGKLILPKQKGIKRKKKGRLIQQRRKIDGGEIITVLTPYTYLELEQGLEVLDRDPEIQDLLAKGWKFAFKFFGNYSYATFPNVELMREYMTRYSGLDEQGKHIQNLELIIVLVGTKFERPQRKRTRRARRKSEGYTSKEFQRMKRRPGRYTRWKGQVRKAMARYRAKAKAKAKKRKGTRSRKK